MSFSPLFFFCVTLNIGLIVYFLLPQLLAAAADLVRGLRRSRLYLACRLDEARERALRQRSLKSLYQLLRLVISFLALVIAYAPSLLFAVYRSDPSAAFVSIEAFTGMAAGAAAASLLRRCA